MNRFLIECFPHEIAQSLCDKHIVKMPLEEATMLSLAIYRYTGKDGETFAEFIERTGLQKGSPRHLTHPCTIWAGDTRANYMWGLKLLEEMSKEYTRRYGRVHKCSLHLPRLKELAIHIPDGNITEHPQCFGEVKERLQTQEHWPINAYRSYYKWKYDLNAWMKKNKLHNTPRWLEGDDYAINT